jgi:hypothetical protein
MPLVPFDLELSTTPLPEPVAAWLAATKAHVDAWLADPARVASGYVPCDHELVYRGLAALRRDAGNGRRFVEFGSGFGIVTGMAASLGFEAHGIEIDRQLVAASRELLAAHSLRASIWQGSFLPAAYVASERLSDLETRTVLSGTAAYDDMELDLDDFDVVYAYPWPTEEEQFCDLFRRHGEPGAVLLTFSRAEGLRAYRNVGGGRRSARRR